MYKKIWQSRFNDRKYDQDFEDLNSSIHFDSRLYKEEIDASLAHAHALNKIGIYSSEEFNNVTIALKNIKKEIESGNIDLSEYEDIHTLVEVRLTELTGDGGLKLQTGRSRNEQTVTAQRLYMKKEIDKIIKKVSNLQNSVLVQAEKFIDAIMPGYTHQRAAQPIRFSQYLMALNAGLKRDMERLKSLLTRVDVSSAGVGALAGATFSLCRETTASDLGFSSISENSLDTITDRDTHLETLSTLSIMMVRLSRLAEDFILWSSPYYDFIELGDTFCTSSSLMPQKINPDGLELVRGKSGKIISNLMSIFVTCKGLPTGYQKDLQEDKEPMFEAFDTTMLSLSVCAGVVDELKIKKEKMKDAIKIDCLATDIADQLVKQGIPFRKAYSIIAKGFDSSGFDITKLGSHAKNIRIPTPEDSVEARNSKGGTSKSSVLEQINNVKNNIL